MEFLHAVLFTIVAISAKVHSYPQNEIIFPEEVGGPSEMSSRPEGYLVPEDRLQQSFTPQGPRPSANFGPPGPTFNGNFRPRPNESFRPPGSFPGQNFRPQISPSGEVFVQTVSRPREGVPRPGGDSIPSSPQPQETSTEIPTTTTPSSDGTTTKIPRRDPTNRIVYTVSCPCQYTNQYVPVCGTDGQTYGNPSVLRCAQQCGTNVQVYLMGSCGRNNGHPGAISLKYK